MGIIIYYYSSREEINSLNSRINDRDNQIRNLENEKYNLWQLYILEKGKLIKRDFYIDYNKVSVKLIKDFIAYEIEKGTDFKTDALSIANNYVDYQLTVNGFVGEYVNMIPHDCMQNICIPALNQARILSYIPTLNVNTPPPLPNWQARNNLFDDPNPFQL